MLRPVKDVHIGGNGFGRDEVWILRHVSRTIHLALVVDLLRDVDLDVSAGEAARLGIERGDGVEIEFLNRH